MSLRLWTGSHCLFVAAALTALTACGGKSGSDGDSSDGDSSDGGTGAGGSSDSGSGTTAGGTDAANTSAGGAGAGGSNTNGTSNAGGAATDGTSTTEGTTTGGASNSGSETSSTTSSTGGSGGTDPVPPPELVEGCAATCDAEVAAGCASGPDASSCADGCNLLTRVPACAEPLGAFFDCIAEDDTTSCSNDDEVVFDACVAEQFDAYACVIQEAPDPDLEEPCESYCTAVAGAMCENDAGDLAGCILYCQSFGTTFPSCETHWTLLLECGETADFECDANGTAQPSGCNAEAVVFLACLCSSDPTVCE